jgi:ABC-type uncharacterized transport system permease subunit
MSLIATVMAMVPANFYTFFATSAGVAGALIGLLFVAISIPAGPTLGDQAKAQRDIKAGTAFSALTDALLISLVALIPGANFATAAILFSVLGVVSTISLAIVLIRTRGIGRSMIRQCAPLVALLVIYALQLVNGVRLTHSPHHHSPYTGQAVLVLAFFGIAITRSWVLAGGRQSGGLASVVESFTNGPRPP